MNEVERCHMQLIVQCEATGLETNYRTKKVEQSKDVCVATI